ncbi:L-arabinokinase [Forsythia ovata]|uniref:L-arabinokinase n=1 Tax=Forsythia ovata TaxID=205694 RepID=A0ABD1W6H3_9LAMI
MDIYLGMYQPEDPRADALKINSIAADAYILFTIFVLSEHKILNRLGARVLIMLRACDWPSAGSSNSLQLPRVGHDFGVKSKFVAALFKLVARHLILAGHDVHVVTGAPDYVFTTEIQSPRLFIRKVLLDCGAIQADALTVDRLASLEKYSETAVVPRDSILETEVEWLKSIKADLVVSDVVPVACRAAADAGIRSIAEDYSHCEFLIRLPGYCPMPAFRDSIDVPLVVRRLHKSREEVRKELGIGEGVKVVILNFGGQPSGWTLKEDYLPPGWLCLLSGARRLRDAIILGYELQRVPGKDLCIPEWYANAENELGLRTGSPTAEMSDDSFVMPPYPEDFEILHGELLGLPDTANFLKSLSELDVVFDYGKSTEKRQMREQKAAANLFNWEEDIFVARAPGRLDVMGGIADYSGSLVLQMPIREACHVAVQKIQPTKQRLWKHAQARQSSKGQGQTPVLQIVSYGSELSNRGPTFDMNLSDFMDGEQPLSYEKARNYFAQDPSQRWAAYVAGTILVLMKELGTRFENSISVLVSSAVPEGKGVSSSAAVEVATMSAIAAAHGLNISPRELALLCQKVENHVVGAPCGVMDQMTSACGEANKLFAMVCQVFDSSMGKSTFYD